MTGQPRTTVFFAVDAASPTPDAWTHSVLGNGVDSQMTFDCRFTTLPLPQSLADDGVMPRSKHEDRGRAVLLSVTAAAAMCIAYLLGFVVLGDSDMASKFENGVAPPGTDIGGIRAAAAGSVVAALGAWVSVIASRRIIPILLMLLTSVPFALLSLVTVQLAF